jgi:hypothetical protein
MVRKVEAAPAPAAAEPTNDTPAETPSEGATEA